MDYKSMKIPGRIYEIYEKYLSEFDTIYDSATSMIHDVIKEKANHLLQELISKKETEKTSLLEIKDRIDRLETELKKSGSK